MPGTTTTVCNKEVFVFSAGVRTAGLGCVTFVLRKRIHTFLWHRLHIEMTVPSPQADVKTVTSVDSLVNLGVNKNGNKLAAVSFLDRGTGTL